MGSKSVGVPDRKKVDVPASFAVGQGPVEIVHGLKIQPIFGAVLKVGRQLKGRIRGDGPLATRDLIQLSLRPAQGLRKSGLSSLSWF